MNESNLILKPGLLAGLLGFIFNKYLVIYADPPWEYKQKGGGKKKGSKRGTANLHYNTMNLQNLKFLPIRDITAKDAFCFMWVTYPMLKEGIELIENWGFEYKTIAFTWVKKTKHGKEFFGMGHYTRANPEFCLLGIKGSPKVKDHSIRNLIIDEVRGHSVKPELVKERIEKLVGKGRKLELFSRKRSPNWDHWGDQIIG